MHAAGKLHACKRRRRRYAPSPRQGPPSSSSPSSPSHGRSRSHRFVDRRIGLSPVTSARAASLARHNLSRSVVKLRQPRAARFDRSSARSGVRRESWITSITERGTLGRPLHGHVYLAEGGPRFAGFKRYRLIALSARIDGSGCSTWAPVAPEVAPCPFAQKRRHTPNSMHGLV